MVSGRCGNSSNGVHSFWSLTLYNEHHFFAPNEINRYSLKTKNKTLECNPDGSLTLYVQAGSTHREAARELAASAEKRRLLALCARLLAHDRNHPRLLDATGR